MTALSAQSPARFNSLLTTNPPVAEGHPPKLSINPYLVNCDTGCTAVLALKTAMKFSPCAPTFFQKTRWM